MLTQAYRWWRLATAYADISDADGACRAFEEAFDSGLHLVGTTAHEMLLDPTTFPSVAALLRLESSVRGTSQLVSVAAVSVLEKLILQFQGAQRAHAAALASVTSLGRSERHAYAALATFGAAQAKRHRRRIGNRDARDDSVVLPPRDAVPILLAAQAPIHVATEPDLPRGKPTVANDDGTSGAVTAGDANETARVARAGWLLLVAMTETETETPQHCNRGKLCRLCNLCVCVCVCVCSSHSGGCLRRYSPHAITCTAGQPINTTAWLSSASGPNLVGLAGRWCVVGRDRDWQLRHNICRCSD
jgi:hypothetical protein